MAESLNKGASNDTIVAILKKWLSPAFKGPGWDALVSAIAAGDQIVADNNRYAFDQLFASSASGKYLLDRAGDVGVEQPPSLGMSDDLFRQFVIKRTNGQLVANALMEMLEVFYSADATRANTTSVSYEPFALTDGDTIDLTIDNQRYTIPFNYGSFKNITQATAIEVAAAINHFFQISGVYAYAQPYTDHGLDKTYVRLYSGSLGIGGFVVVTGGKAQNALKFPTVIDLFPSGFTSISWNVDIPSPGFARYTATGAGSMPTGFINVVPGDYVNIYGTGFSASNRGSFQITDVYVDYAGATPSINFTIQNQSAVAQSAVAQSLVSDLLAFRPTKNTLSTLQRAAYILQYKDGGFALKLPVTTQVVNRTKFTGAYAQPYTELNISSISRASTGIVTVVTATSHGLAAGDQIFVDGVRSSVGVNAGRFNNMWTVASVTNSTTFTFNTSMLTAASGTGGKVTPWKATASVVPGPYILDPNGGYGVTGTETTLSIGCSRNTSYGQLIVASTASFPKTSGWLVLGFGTKDEVGPIPYHGVIDSTRLKVDPSFIFPKTVASGTKVTALVGKGAWVPDSPESAGCFYVTASNAGLAAAINTIKKISATGSQIEQNVVYPGDRGLGGEGKNLSDKIGVWGGDNLDIEWKAARDG